MDGRKAMLSEIQRSDRGRGRGDREHLASRGIGSEARPSLIVPRCFLSLSFFSACMFQPRTAMCTVWSPPPYFSSFPLISRAVCLSIFLSVRVSTLLGK